MCIVNDFHKIFPPIFNIAALVSTVVMSLISIDSSPIICVRDSALSHNLNIPGLAV